jgi:hypothetical protein
MKEAETLFSKGLGEEDIENQEVDFEETEPIYEEVDKDGR